VTLCNKVCNCEICKTLNVKPLLWIERSQLRWFSHVSRMPHKRLAGHVLLAQKVKQPTSRDHMDWLPLRPCLVLSLCGASRIIWKIIEKMILTLWGFESSKGCFPCNPLESKAKHETKWMIHQITESPTGFEGLTMVTVKSFWEAANISSAYWDGHKMSFFHFIGYMVYGCRT